MNGRCCETGLNLSKSGFRQAQPSFALKGHQQKRRITADTALRLAQYFNMSAEFWLGLQMDYDLEVATDQIGKRVQKEVVAYSVAS